MKVIQQDFEDYYRGVWGERWQALREALSLPEKQVRRYNSLAKQVSAFSAPIEGLPLCSWHTHEDSIPRGPLDLLSYYVLDPASVMVAENLKVVPGEKVLDLCAAPGGKSLVLAQNLFASRSSSSELVLNELSPDRRERLKKVIQQYIPRDIRDQVWIRGKDGTRFGLEAPAQFDAILLDAPCSGERHLLENQRELQSWKVQRTKGLAQKQYALLCSAWLALKPGGRLMYSTCSLSPLENDGVISKFLKKKDDAQVSRVSLRLEGAEETENGVLYLPDQNSFGPMFSCLLEKSPT